jgi:hypothetical protein
MVVALTVDALLRVMVVARLPAMADTQLQVSAAAIPRQAAMAADHPTAVRHTAEDRTAAAVADMGGNIVLDSVPAQ